MADFTQGFEPYQSIISVVNQTGHGFTMPAQGFIPVYLDGAGDWQTAQANSSTTLHQGFVVTVIDANSFYVQFDGILKATHGLTGTYQYLSPATAGAVTTTEPDPASEFAVLACTVVDSETLHLRANRILETDFAVKIKC